MSDGARSLQIELEELAGAAWWASLLSTLTSQSGSSLMRFVAYVGGKRRYCGTTFASPRTLGRLPVEEGWAPGMSQSLLHLRQQLEQDGWLEVGRGAEPWAYRYEHP